MNKATEAAMVAGTAVWELAGSFEKPKHVLNSFNDWLDKQNQDLKRQAEYAVKWQYTYPRMLAKHKTVNGKARPGDLARPACKPFLLALPDEWDGKPVEYQKGRLAYVIAFNRAARESNNGTTTRST